MTAAAEKEVVFDRIPAPTWRWLGVNEVLSLIHI